LVLSLASKRELVILITMTVRVIIDVIINIWAEENYFLKEMDTNNFFLNRTSLKSYKSVNKIIYDQSGVTVKYSTKDMIRDRNLQRAVSFVHM